MGKYSTEFFVGMDVSDKSVEICILKQGSEEGACMTVRNCRESLEAFAGSFARPEGVSIAMETGPQSNWMADFLRARKLGVTVANARKLRAIWQSDDKCDGNDAEMLARLLRADPKLLAPVTVKERKFRDALLAVKARDCLSRCRAKLITTVRGLLKSEGVSSSEIDAQSFGVKIMALIPKPLIRHLKPLVEEVSRLDAALRRYDKEIERLRKEFDGCEAVAQIKGVGPLTSLAFVLVVGDPTRFENGERLSSYLGLVPRRNQSGETDRQCHITKAGNGLLRRYLVQAAHYIMGPFGDKECDLRRFGERIAARGGRNAKKRAVIAVARKLAVLMLKLWKSGEEYEPLRSKRGRCQAKAEAAA